jgi:hypothetical protein
MGKDRPTQTVRSVSLEMIDAERNRLEHATSGVRSEIVIHIDYLRKRLKRIEGDIDGAVRRSEVWRDKEQLMDSVPGVGRLGFDLRCLHLLALPFQVASSIFMPHGQLGSPVSIHFRGESHRISTTGANDLEQPRTLLPPPALVDSRVWIRPEVHEQRV